MRIVLPIFVQHSTSRPREEEKEVEIPLRAEVKFETFGNTHPKVDSILFSVMKVLSQPSKGVLQIKELSLVVDGVHIKTRHQPP